MPEIEESTSAEPKDDPKEDRRSRRERRRAEREAPSMLKRALAGILSGLVPGAGQMFVLKQRRLGGFLLFLFIVFAVIVFSTRLPASFAGHFVSRYVLTTICVLAAALAFFTRPRVFESVTTTGILALLVIVASFFAGATSSSYVLRAAGFHSFFMPMTMMAPAIGQGESVVADLNWYKSHTLQHGDLVVVNINGDRQIRRVVALGGDSLMIRGAIVTRNGQLLQEPWVKHTFGGSPMLPSNRGWGPGKLGQDEVFLMGDNRDVSFDSRHDGFGPRKRSEIEGKPLFILQSREWNRVGKPVN